MKTSILYWSMLASWVMAIAYDRIEQMTGIEINILLVGALVTMAVGLYMGLYWKGNVELEEKVLAE